MKKYKQAFNTSGWGISYKHNDAQLDKLYKNTGYNWRNEFIVKESRSTSLGFKEYKTCVSHNLEDLYLKLEKKLVKGNLDE